jgi:hypothetical protein
MSPTVAASATPVAAIATPTAFEAIPISAPDDAPPSGGAAPASSLPTAGQSGEAPQSSSPWLALAALGGAMVVAGALRVRAPRGRIR